MPMAKPTFEDCLVFIENKLSIQLLIWQKVALQKIYENKSYYFASSRGMGLNTLNKATTLLEEFKKENEL
jgi:hypothetical protein